MKTKIIPFDLETAKKIQAGEIDGKIKTRRDKREMWIVCYDSTARYCGDLQPIIAQDIEDCGNLCAYFEDGAYIKEDKHPRDLVLEVPDNEPRFKPFDRVLVRDQDDCNWCADFYSHLGDDGIYICVSCGWNQCIPYEGHENLLGTTDKPKEE